VSLSGFFLRPDLEVRILFKKKEIEAPGIVGLSKKRSVQTHSFDLPRSGKASIRYETTPGGKIAQGTTHDDILSVVGDVCYIQWDPIVAVAPSHIISFWSRLGNFHVPDLDKLLRDERSSSCIGVPFYRPLRLLFAPRFSGEKISVQFPIDKLLPVELIKSLIKARIGLSNQNFEL
jgi:hypothetical protein